jgi:hypothetical protein
MKANTFPLHRSLNLPRTAKTSSYLLENGICYLTLTERSFPKQNAFGFLHDLQKSFQETHGHEIASASRPYVFQKFGVYAAQTAYQQARRFRKTMQTGKEYKLTYSFFFFFIFARCHSGIFHRNPNPKAPEAILGHSCAAQPVVADTLGTAGRYQHYDQEH